VPELPEVEVVRRGIESHALDSRVAAVQVLNPRAVRQHIAGAADFSARLTGARLSQVCRRGKFLWLPLREDECLVIHLGMSGQVLVQRRGATPSMHTRIVIDLGARRPLLFFDDQRTFGGMHISSLTPAPDGRAVPESAVHIAPDPFEDAFDADGVARTLRSRTAGIKSLLLNQGIVSGIGNIYADEALWRARVHWRTPGLALSQRKALTLLAAAREVMGEALDVGGTSFDSLYVNVNGQSGYFSRSLNAYGQEGEPCGRCGTLIRREPFANRSSFRCPKCQRG